MYLCNWHHLAFGNLSLSLQERQRIMTYVTLQPSRCQKNGVQRCLSPTVSETPHVMLGNGPCLLEVDKDRMVACDDVFSTSVFMDCGADIESRLRGWGDVCHFAIRGAVGRITSKSSLSIMVLVRFNYVRHTSKCPSLQN